MENGAVCISKRITANLKGKAIVTPTNGETTKTRRTTTDIGKRNKYKNTGKPPALASSGVEISYHSLGGPTYACPNCNATMWYEERNNKGNKDQVPTFSLCCQQGKVLLPRFKDTPEPLKRLLDYTQPATSTFRDLIRVYNGMFCFTSFGAKIDHSINKGRGLYTFRINRQNYHRIGSLLPTAGTQPSEEGVDGTIVGSLIRMLDANSAIAKAFRMARDWCHANASVNVELYLLSEGTSSKQYNAPTIAEVAALISNDFGDGEPTRDIVVCQKDSPPKRILELHPSYMVLQYPLLFPYREDGYHEQIPYLTNKGKRKTARDYVTMKEYYAYVIQYRKDLWTTLHRGGRGDTDAAGLGKRIVLPISFTGGPRYMMQNYQDEMALCRAYGNPNQFITFTSNPKWPEIIEMLAYIPGKRAHHSPEVGNQQPMTLHDTDCLPALLQKEGIDLTTEQIQNYCLMEIQDLLNTNGRALSEFIDMPQPNPALLTSVDNRLLREARAFDMNKSRIQHQELYPQLNPEQRLIYEEVVDSVHNKKGQFHFVYRPGGTRKTFLYKIIISRLRSELKIVLAVASSGIASLLLPGGRTAHSKFVIPLELLENSTCLKEAEYMSNMYEDPIYDEVGTSYDITDRSRLISFHNKIKMSNMSEDIQYVGSDTRPPMLDRTYFDSWKQRIHLYCLGKDNGENIMKSITEERTRVFTIPYRLKKKERNYTLISHYTDAKDIWDKVKMILEGSELTKDDRESQLYDEFERFLQIKGETSCLLC
ncbi:AT-hook motif-containing protein [Tanacetum coccineum]